MFILIHFLNFGVGSMRFLQGLRNKTLPLATTARRLNHGDGSEVTSSIIPHSIPGNNEFV